MNENLTNTRSTFKNKNFSVRLTPGSVDERLAYVESVCAAWIDQRFGRTLTLFLDDFSDWPEDVCEPVCEMDLMCQVPRYAVFAEMVDGDAADLRRHAATVIPRELADVRLLTARSCARPLSPSNPGRGSPKYLWDARNCRSPARKQGRNTQLTDL